MRPSPSSRNHCDNSWITLTKKCVWNNYDSILQTLQNCNTIWHQLSNFVYALTTFRIQISCLLIWNLWILCLFLFPTAYRSIHFLVLMRTAFYFASFWDRNAASHHDFNVEYHIARVQTNQLSECWFNLALNYFIINSFVKIYNLCIYGNLTIYPKNSSCSH